MRSIEPSDLDPRLDALSNALSWVVACLLALRFVQWAWELDEYARLVSYIAGAALIARAALFLAASYAHWRVRGRGGRAAISHAVPAPLKRFARFEAAVYRSFYLSLREKCVPPGTGHTFFVKSEYRTFVYVAIF